MTSVAAAAGVFLLATLAPFEATTPIVKMPWQSISNLEGALLLALGAWAAALIWSRCVPRWRTPLTSGWLAFLAAMALAAAVAPSQRVNAWHMTGRLAAAAAVGLLTFNGVTSARRFRVALALSVGSGVIVASLAILEYFQIEAVLRLLQVFRPSVAVVGAQVRAGGPLQYPTIASMYLEVTFAFGLGLMVGAVDASSRLCAGAWFAALLLVAEAIMLTFTRAGLITMAVSLVLVGVWRVWQRGFETGVLLISGLSVAVVALFLSSRSAQMLWLRMTSEGQEAWYRARIEAPRDLSMSTDQVQDVTLAVTNTGRIVWDSGDTPPDAAPIRLSYHWLQEDGRRVLAFEGMRTAFDHTVEPGRTMVVHASVRPPRRPGVYRLEWDVVQEGRLWFSTEQGAPASTVSMATVDGPSLGGPLVTVDRPRREVRPGRLVLWSAAGRMFLAHPLLGVGPDNYRLLYGDYAGLAGADPRTHSNNMYLEILAGGGIVAAIALIWFLRQAVPLFVSLCGRADPRYVGVAAAGLAIALHGTVDSFLSFGPTYILFSLTLGFAAALARGVEPAADAHRV